MKRKTYRIKAPEDLEVGMFYIDDQFGKIEVLEIRDPKNVIFIVDEFIVPQRGSWEVMKGVDVMKKEDYPEYFI